MYVLQTAGSQHVACVVQVRRITNATLPLIDGFRNNLLASPVFVDASQIATSSPLLENLFNTIGNFSNDLAPVLRAYTVCFPQLLMQLLVGNTLRLPWL